METARVFERQISFYGFQKIVIGKNGITCLVVIVVSNVAQIVGRINRRNGFPVDDAYRCRLRGCCLRDVAHGDVAYGDPVGLILVRPCTILAPSALEKTSIESFYRRSRSRIFCTYSISFCHPS